jgi:ubiquinone/menaquinone biosynthesis C-methylase UbiE
MSVIETSPGANICDEVPEFPPDDSGWAAYFDQYASRYERSAFGGSGLAYIGRREVDAVLTALHSSQPGAILDAGAGTGRVARAALAAGWQVTALDASPQMLARIADELPATRIVHATLGRALPLPDASFDAVVSMRVLKYVDDLECALNEFARVVRPGGRAVLEIANRRSLARFGYRNAPVHFLTVRQIEQMIRAAGFEPTTRFAGSRLPQPVWSHARSRRAASVVAACDRAIGSMLGGSRTCIGARSVIVTGLRG